MKVSVKRELTVCINRFLCLLKHGKAFQDFEHLSINWSQVQHSLVVYLVYTSRT